MDITSNKASPSVPDALSEVGINERPLTHALRMRGIRFVLLNHAIRAVHNNIAAGAVLTGYALFLGATNYQIGLLSSVPNIAQALQGIAPVFTERLQNRKRVHTNFNLVSYLIWIPVALLPFFLPRAFCPWGMIGLVGLAAVVNAWGNPAGVAWFTDLVPPEMWGRFYARVNTLLTVSGMITALIAGRYVDITKDRYPLFSFSSIIIIGVIFAVISNGVLRLVPEPARKRGESQSSLEVFLLPFKNHNFRRLMIFFAVRSMAVMIAAPFFSVFWIKELKLSFSFIAVISALLSLSGVASYQIWAYLSDKYGNKPITKICWTGMCFIPLSWFFVTLDNHLWAAPAAALWGGFFGGGVLITQMNLRAQIAPEENRSVYIGCFNGVVCSASALGPVIGGLLAVLLKDVHFSFLHVEAGVLKSLFLVSAACRFACSPLLWLVEEEGEKPAQFILRQIPARSPVASLLNLIRFSRSSRTSERQEAVRALGSTKTRLAMEELVAALQDSSWEVRREAARSLGDIGDARAIDGIVGRLEDRETDIVEECAEALGKMQDPSVLGPLVLLLESDRPTVRRSAASALGALGSVRGVAYLERLIQRETDQSVYLTAVDALSRIGGANTIHYLRSLVRNSKPGIYRQQLVRCIGSLLGPEGEFYRLLRADQMSREEMVAKMFSSIRQRLAPARRGKRETDEDLEFVQVHLDAANLRYDNGEYVGSITCLRRSVMRALGYFTCTETGRQWMTAHNADENGGQDASSSMVGLLLAANDHLKQNVGYLQGLDRETRSRPPFDEEMLLAVFAVHQIGIELAAMRRAPKATT